MSDRIRLSVRLNADAAEAVAAFRRLVETETLADIVEIETVQGAAEYRVEKR